MKLNLLRLFLTILIFITMSCSSQKPDGKTEAEVLYKEALELVADERYIFATERLNQLKNQYPYSVFATPAELLQADIFFKQENFIEAAAAYLLFRDFHPKHERIDYVVFQIGNSYFKQIPSTYDRDLSPAIEAIKYFQELKASYPTSLHIPEAEENIQKSQILLQKKQLYIADFYYKTEQYSAAIWRYLDILENYGDVELRQHSMTRIVLSSLKLEKYSSCVDYYLQFEGMLQENNIKSLRSVYQDCRDFLKKGLESKSKEDENESS
jgi:outer membrane protein assembly factor BamD